MVAAHLGIIVITVRLQSESILRHPFARFAPAKHSILAVRNDTISVTSLHLFRFFIKQQRLEKRIAKTYVGQPTFFQLHDERHMIKPLAESACLAGNFRRKHCDVKPEREQQRREQTVAFITEATATAFDDLGKQRIIVKDDRLGVVNAQILERYRAKMGNLQRSQSLGRGRSRALIADAFEISVDVHKVYFRRFIAATPT